MRSREREARLLVARQCVYRRLESAHAVAIFAAIQVRCGNKLPLMNILMAALAGRLRDLVNRVLSLGDVALVARDRSMAPIERVHARRMRRHGEGRRLEPIDRMTRTALALVRPRHELPVMRVLVTIRAERVCHRSFEVAACVAIGARHRGMLAQQREIRLRVIEALELRHAIPIRRVVARLAGPGEGAFVRIAVAAGARREGQPNIFHIRLGVSHGNVAFRAGHGRMSARK